MVRFIIEVIFLYALYKFIFDLVIPMITVSRKAKKHFDQMNNQQPSGNAGNGSTSQSKKDVGEYIDYEEVK